MITNAELEYMAKMPARMKGIEDQLKRIADSLENIATFINQQKSIDNESTR